MPPVFAVAAALALLASCGVAPRAPVAEVDRGGVHGERGVVTGVVRDPAAAGSADAWVTVEPGGYETRTDAGGRFRLAGLPPGPVVIWARAPGGRPARVEAEVLAGRETTVNLTSAPAEAGATARIAVAGPDGEALEGVVVEVDGAARGATRAEGVVSLIGVEGDDVVLSLVDPEGRVAGADLVVGALPAAGGVQWTASLSGLADADARVLGSTACGACHPAAFAAWSETAHAHALATEPGPDARAAFRAGEPVDLGAAATATPSADGDTLRVTLRGAAGGIEEVEVAGWIGWPDRAAVPWTERDGRAWPLPLAWRAPDPARPGYPGAGLRAWTPERWRDDAGRLRHPAPDQSAEAACLGCHATGFTRSVGSDGDVEMRATVGSGRALEDAVGCERCHGPGGDHRRRAAQDPSWHITNPASLTPARADAVCGQCHGVLADHDFGLPAPGGAADGFQPGDRLDDHAASTGALWPSGAAADAPMQWEEHAASAHGVAGLRCIDCHGGHGGSAGDTRQPARDGTLCAACHADVDVEAHAAHVVIDPLGPTEGGRCIGCHMPGTATTLGWDPLSGAGDAASHTFVALPPADTLALFDGDTAALGAFPAHACGDCHAWNAWRFGESGVGFPGPDGDPTRRETHEAFDVAFGELYP